MNATDPVPVDVAPPWIVGFVAEVEGRETVRFGGAVAAYYPRPRAVIVATAAHAFGPDPSHLFFGHARLDEVPPKARVPIVGCEVLTMRKGDLALFKAVLPADYAGPEPSAVPDEEPQGPAEAYFWGHEDTADVLWHCGDLQPMRNAACAEAIESARRARAIAVGWCVECPPGFCLPGSSGGPVLRAGQLAGVFSAEGRTRRKVMLGIVSDRTWRPIVGRKAKITDVARACGPVRWEDNPMIDGVFGDVGPTFLSPLARTSSFRRPRRRRG